MLDERFNRAFEDVPVIEGAAQTLAALEGAGIPFAVASNSLIFESSLRDDTLWAARNEYRLRHVDGELRMAHKKVVLVNNDKAIYTLSFLV